MARSRWFAAVAGSLAVAGGMLGSTYMRYRIAEDSMRPVLQPGDLVIVRRGVRTLHRGTIAIFGHPEIPSMDLVKRVVGLPGETVEISNGQVHVDGSILAEPWADGPTIPDGTWHLGDDELFVLGDARPRSSGDSRMIGPVLLSSTHGQVRGVYWPPTRLGRIAR